MILKPGTAGLALAVLVAVSPPQHPAMAAASVAGPAATAGSEAGPAATAGSEAGPAATAQSEADPAATAASEPGPVATAASVAGRNTPAGRTASAVPRPAGGPLGTAAALVDPPVNVVAVAATSAIRVTWQNPPMELGVANYVAAAEPGGGSCATLDWRTFGCLLGAAVGRTYRVSVRTNGTSEPAYAPAMVTPVAPRPPAIAPGSAPSLRVTVGPRRIEVRGDGFLADSTVAVAVYRANGTAPRLLGLPTADGYGRVARTFPVPPGRHVLLAQGVDPGGEQRLLTARPEVAGGAGGSADLPVTGRGIWPAVATGIALVVIGAAALLLGRRRRG